MATPRNNRPMFPGRPPTGRMTSPRRMNGSRRARCRGCEHPELEGLEPANGRRLRPVRQRKNGRQGAARPLRFEAGHRPHRGPEPDWHVGDLGHPHWNDYVSAWAIRERGNYVPDCDLGNFGINGECGAISNNNFGQNNPNATVYDPDVLNGYGKRDANWDFSTEIQHELRPGFGRHRRLLLQQRRLYRQAGSRKRVTDNLLVTQADYDTYCIKAPSNADLPGGGGYDVCGLANVDQDSFGKVQNFVTSRESFGEFESRNDFFNIAFDARLAHGIRLGGGLTRAVPWQTTASSSTAPRHW